MGKQGNPQWQKNLVMWKKGQSGNPKGRPKKLPDIKKLLIKVLGEIDKPTGMSGTEAVLTVLRTYACKGDTRAAEILLERAYGKVTQNIDVFDQRQKVAELFPEDILNECRTTDPGTFEQRENGKTDKSEFSPPNTEP